MIRKITYLIILIFSYLSNAQPPSSTSYSDNLSSIRIGGGGSLDKDYRIDRKFIALDFLQEIAGEDFYIGGSFSLLKFPKEQETDKNKTIVFPEISIRKYLYNRGFYPYAQLNTFYAGTTLGLGIQPNAYFFDLDILLRYTQPFLNNPTQKYPYIKQGFEVSIAVSFNIDFWSSIIFKK